MITVTVDKTTATAVCAFNGKEQKLSLQKVNKESVKPGTYWINLKPLGTPKQWYTVNFNNYPDTDTFDVEIDEMQHRTVKPRISRVITFGNIKDFLSEEDAATFDALKEKAEAEAKRRADEAEANKPVKEKKSRKMTIEERRAKLLEEMKALEAAEAEGKVYFDETKPKKSKKQAVIEDLDVTEGLDTQEVSEDTTAF